MSNAIVNKKVNGENKFISPALTKEDFNSLIDLYYLSAVISQCAQDLAKDIKDAGIQSDSLNTAINSISRLEITHDKLKSLFSYGKQ